MKKFRIISETREERGNDGILFRKNPGTYLQYLRLYPSKSTTLPDTSVGIAENAGAEWPSLENPEKS